MIIKLYDTWRKAKQVFVKPSLRVYFGSQKNCPDLIYSSIVTNCDVGWKWKWNEIRFEDCPVFAIKLFGLVLSFSLHCPANNVAPYTDDLHYWEAILIYLYNNKSKTLREAILKSNIWRKYGEEEVLLYFAVRPEYIKQKYMQEYEDTIAEIRAKNKFNII